MITMMTMTMKFLGYSKYSSAYMRVIFSLLIDADDYDDLDDYDDYDNDSYDESTWVQWVQQCRQGK